MNYYYGGHWRFSVFGENPNITGMAFACSVVLLSGIQLARTANGLASEKGGLALYIYGFQHSRWLRPLFQCAGVLAMIVTYSRGAVMGYLSGHIVLAYYYGKDSVRNGTRRLLWRQLAYLLLFTLIVALFTGFYGRVTPLYITHDRGIGNRIELWTAALKCISCEPFAGWGYRNGMVVFSQWFQPINLSFRYNDLVCSYMEIANNWGLIVLALLLTQIILIVLAPISEYMPCAFRLFSLSSGANRAMAASAFCAAIAGVFSTLCYSMVFWVYLILGTISAMSIYVRCPRRIVFRVTAAAVATSSVICAGIVFTARTSSDGPAFRACASCWVRVTNASRSGEKWAILANRSDFQCPLVDAIGGWLRKSGRAEAYVYIPQRNDTSSRVKNAVEELQAKSGVNCILVAGDYTECDFGQSKWNRVVLVNPSIVDVPLLRNGTQVLLSRIDRRGVNTALRQACLLVGATVVEIGCNSKGEDFDDLPSFK